MNGPLFLLITDIIRVDPAIKRAQRDGSAMAGVVGQALVITRHSSTLVSS